MTDNDKYKKTSITLSENPQCLREFFYRDIFSDNYVIEQNFIKKEYSTENKVIDKRITEEYESLLKKGLTPVIIDCGANIGTSVLHYISTYPKAHIIAIEPDKENFDLLTLNTFNLNVTLLNKGVSCEDGIMKIEGDKDKPFAYYLTNNEQSSGELVDVVSIPTLLSMMKELHPFIIKIDIEGGESFLFNKNTQWIDDFYLITIELHDWLYPKKGTSRPFLNAISQYNRDFVYFGEIIFSLKNDKER